MPSKAERYYQKVDKLIQSYRYDDVFLCVKIHSIVTKFFGFQNLFEMGPLYGAKSSSFDHFTCEVRRQLYRLLALEHHPDKGGNTQQAQFIMGEFNNFINDDRMLRMYLQYLHSMDSFHSLIGAENLNSEDEWYTYQSIALPDGFPVKFPPADSIGIFNYKHIKDEVTMPLFCHPKMIYDEVRNTFVVDNLEVKSNEKKVVLVYKAKFGRRVFYALKFHQKPNRIFWISRQDVAEVPYLAKQARKSFFRFKSIKRLQKTGKLSMSLRNSQTHSCRAILP